VDEAFTYMGGVSDKIPPFNLGTTHGKHKNIRFFETKISSDSSISYDYVGQELLPNPHLPTTVGKAEFQDMTRAGPYSYNVRVRNPKGQIHTYHVLMYQGE
jgi:hypothetical protein